MSAGDAVARSPVVSIVVPAYNAGAFLTQTLQSLQSQSFQDWECVVVDDGSADDTATTAEAFAAGDPRIRVHRGANGGASAARNRGFRLTDPASRYVVFMDSDDVWLPHALALLVEAAERHDGIGSHGLAELIDERGALTAPGVYPARGRMRWGLSGRRLRVLPVSAPTDYNVLINGNVLFPPGLVLVSRGAYEAVGPFDESFSGPEDWDMLIRLSRRGSLAFVDDVVLHYRRHSSNLGAGTDVARQAWLVRCKAFHSPENTVRQQRDARRGWRAQQLQLAVRNVRQVDTDPLSKDQPSPRRWPFVAACLVRSARGYPLPKVVRRDPAW